MTSLTVSHEFNSSETISNEKNVTDMITFIESYENPFCLSFITEPKLHNILTQEIMTEEIRNVTCPENRVIPLFDIPRRKIHEKTKRLSDTIHRNNLKTFTSIRTEKEAIESKKEKKKESAQAQKLIEPARVRGFDSEELFKYNLVPSKFFFGVDGIMTKPMKVL